MSAIHSVSFAESLEWPSPNWIIDGWLLDRGITVLSGSPKAGKTTAAASMMFSVATGRAWADRFAVNRPCPVMAILAESPAGVRNKIIAMAQSAALAPEELPIRISRNMPSLQDDLYFASEEDVAFARNGLLVIDNLSLLAAVSGARLNDWGDMAKTKGQLRDFAQEHLLSVLLIHHRGKSGSDLGGSTMIDGSVDVAHLVQQAKGERVIKPILNREGKTAEPVPFSIVEMPAVIRGESRMAGVAVFEAASSISREEQALLHLIEHLRQNGVPSVTTGIKAAWDRASEESPRPAGIWPDELEALLARDPKTLRSRLKGLAERGLVQQVQNGKIPTFSILPAGQLAVCGSQ